MQVVKADDYRDDDRNSRVLVRAYERERGSIALAGPNRPLIARSMETDDRLRYLRTYPGAQPVRPRHRLLLADLRPDAVEEQPGPTSCPATTRSCSSRRLSDQLTGREARGGDVVLTVQQAAQQAAVEALGDNAVPSSPSTRDTGAVLAMASAPTYDPTRLSSHDPEAIRDYWAALQDDDAGAPLLNRAISELYPPGSTFKVVTAAAALENGLTPESEIPAPDELLLPQTTTPLPNFGGAALRAGGRQTPRPTRCGCRATPPSPSSASTSARRAAREGAGVRLRGRGAHAPERVAGSRIPADLDPPQIAQSAIGQRDVRATPLQMAMVAAGIANDGTVMKPYVVREVQGPDLSRLEHGPAGGLPRRGRRRRSPSS